MSTLTVTPSYVDSSVLYEADLDAVKSTIETFYNTTGIEGSNLQTAMITGSTKIANNAITTAKILDSNITTTKLADEAVTTSKIADSAITAAKIYTSQITTAKIADNAVTTAKIGDGQVPKNAMLLVPTNSATLTNASISIVNSNATQTPALIGSVTATGLTASKPLIVAVQSSGINGGLVGIQLDFSKPAPGDGYTFSAIFDILLYKDSVLFATCRCEAGDVDTWTTANRVRLYLPASSFVFIDNNVTSNSHTYSLYARQVEIPIYSFNAGSYYGSDESATAIPTFATLSGSISTADIKLVTTQVV